MSLLTCKKQMRQRRSLKLVVIISSCLLAPMSLFSCRTQCSSDVAENVDEKLLNRAWPNVYQFLSGFMMFMKIVLSSVDFGVLNVMYSVLFVMIFRGR